MNLKDAFAGISAARSEVPEHLSTQEPKSLSTEAPKHPGAQAPRRSGTQAPKHLSTQAPRHLPLPLQGSAKSRHPEFEAVKIYVRSETRRRAWRKWEDATGGDFSDLVEMLLQQYLSA